MPEPASPGPARPPAGEVLARVVGFPADVGPIDIELRRGDIVILRGRNGSGKTSLLRCLAGLPSPLRPASLEVAGTQPSKAPAAWLARHVGCALQDPRETLVGLTVAGEFRLRGRPVPDGLAALRDRDVATLSSGEARRTSLAAADHGAALLLLDEPEEGLDSARQEDLLALVARARLEGAVVVAEHGGLFDALATNEVRLSPDSEPHVLDLPAPNGATVLQAPASRIQRGGRTLDLPSLALPTGFHGLAGPNGSGKSTFLLALAGLLEGTGATVGAATAVAGDNVRLLLPRAGDLFAADRVQAEISDCDPLGLVANELLPRHPLSLSAGEAQRVALAKTLGKPAPVYLLDEPEAHLDDDGRGSLVEAIARRIREGSCILAATHDAPLLAACATVVRLEAP